MKLNNLSTSQFATLLIAMLAGLIIVGVLIAGDSFSLFQSGKGSAGTSSLQREATTSKADKTSTSTATSSDTTEANSSLDQSEVLTASVAAVSRVTASGMSPQAGVLLADARDQNRLVIPITNPPNTAEGLFENGVVVDLSLTSTQSGSFSVYKVDQASGSVSPLSVSEHSTDVGMEMYVVPLSGQPQIFRTTVESVNEVGVQTGANNLPAGSLLLNDQAEVVGLFDPNNGRFTQISSIMTN